MLLKVKSSIWMVVLLFAFLPGVDAADGPKRTVKGNMTVDYKQLPGEASSFTEMFTQGMFYGRLRANTFYYDWDDEVSGKARDNWAVGIGGSAIFKSAYLAGFGATAGLYTSQNPWHMDESDVGLGKSGKDTFSRYKVATGDDYGMTVLAEAFLEYKFQKSNVRLGRQIFESFLTASNDTKMIPNTFEGLSFESKLIPATDLKAAVFEQQKLRDHTSFHHVLAFGEKMDDRPFGTWSENDDAVMHKGLTKSRLDAENIDDRLFVLQATNKFFKNLSLMANYTTVPELVSSATAEANYTIAFNDDFKIVPGIRYMHQFDDGAGDIGGASLSGKVSAASPRGYDDPENLDTDLYAARINMEKGAGSLLVGYSKVTDDADIVAPWRGFPTGGYTRGMAQYNWFADTETWMVQAGYDFGKAGRIKGFSTKIAYVIQNFDDAKPDVQADSNLIWIDMVQKIAAVPGLDAKLRFGFADGDSDTIAFNGSVKDNPSYNEYRFEMNYLF